LGASLGGAFCFITCVHLYGLALALCFASNGNARLIPQGPD
jgi:hypothetical protein